MSEVLTKEQAFARLWSPSPGLTGFLGAVNNQILGLRFMVTALVFFLLGGVEALIMRLQLARSDNTLIGPEVYNQLFTMHGSTMMYLFAVPFVEGLALYLIPLLIGSRDVAFPRLTSFCYWSYLFGGLVFYWSFFTGNVPDAGWFAYTPLSSAAYSAEGKDYWLLGLALVEVSGILAAIEVVTTILKFRAPGMTLARMPIFVWAVLVSGVMIIFAFTTLLVASLLLELDRAVGTRFFNPDFGGSSLLWQHLFWFFGHPEVYIIFLPAAGVVSTIIPVFARRPLAGYRIVVVSIVVIGFLSFGLWAHHMFTTGLPVLALSFFTAASLLIAIASGAQVFAWIATLWGTKPTLSTPMLYVLGFLSLFVVGGMTGVMIAFIPFDIQVHDTFFIVAHFHYVLIGGVVFPLLAAGYYWLPKMTGRLPDESLGKWSFWLSFAGFNLTFFPMHVMGFAGLPRRVYTYPASLEIDGINLLATVGAFLFALGILAYLYNGVRAIISGQRAPSDPWSADSLEWSLSSPPLAYSFSRPPVVRARHPLWRVDGQINGDADHSELERASRLLELGPRGFRANLVTDAIEAGPQAIQALPGPTLLPLCAAVTLLVAATAFLNASYFLAGAAGLFLGVLVLKWLWPDRRLLQAIVAWRDEAKVSLPVFPDRSMSTAYWGAIGALTTGVVVIGALVYSYAYLALYSDQWPQNEAPLPSLSGLALAQFLPLFAVIVSRTARRFELKRARRLVVDGPFVLFGIGFLICLGLELSASNLHYSESAYASVVISLRVSVAIGVAIGVIGTGFAWMREYLAQKYGIETDVGRTISLLMWDFLAVVSVVVYAVVHLSPHLLKS